MKIFFLTYGLELGGAPRQMVMLARGLRDAGDEVAVLCFYRNGPMEQELAEAGIRLIPLEKRGRWDLGFFIRLLRIIRHEKPQVLHGYLTIANLVAVLGKLACPSLKVVWGMRASTNNVRRNDWTDSVIFLAESAGSRLADLIIHNSHAGRQFCKQNGFRDEHAVVIHNGIDVERFHPDSDARLRLRDGWGILPDQFLIGLVARFDPMKDHPTFLRAAALLTARRADVRFVCVGYGRSDSYRLSLEALAQELNLNGRLVWAGLRLDIEAVHNALDVETLTSSYGEGFPNVIGEAMASGVPCVVTDVGDSAVLVGDAGIVVVHGDPSALADAWDTMLRHLVTDRDAISHRVRERIAEHFSVPHLARNTRQMLQDLVGGQIHEPE